MKISSENYVEVVKSNQEQYFGLLAGFELGAIYI
jgi:hypothetical protein